MADWHPVHWALGKSVCLTVPLVCLPLTVRLTCLSRHSCLSSSFCLTQVRLWHWCWHGFWVRHCEKVWPPTCLPLSCPTGDTSCLTLLAWHLLPDTALVTYFVSGTVGLIKHVISVTTWTVTTPASIGWSEVFHSLLEVSDASGVSVLNICWFFVFCSLFCPFSLRDE